MKKRTYCMISLSLPLLAGCATDNSQHTNTDTPNYQVEKVKNEKEEQLDKTIINSPPTPPKGYERPVVEPDTTDKKDNHTTP